MRRHILLLLLAFLCAVSCSTPRYVSTQPDLQAEWVLRSHADIVRAFGAPSREVSDGADGEILVYEEFYTSYDPDYTTSRELRNYKEFYLDAEGICYDVRSNETVENGRKFDFASTFWTILPALLCVIPYIL